MNSRPITITITLQLPTGDANVVYNGNKYEYIPWALTGWKHGLQN